MNKKLILFTWILLNAFIADFAQSWIQIGQNINGQKFSEYFGNSVSINGDGTIIATGSQDANSRTGLVRIYKNQSGDWTQIGDDINGEASSDYSGCTISLNSPGNIVAIGANYNNDNGVSSGHVRVYENQDGSWIQIGQDIDGDSAYDISGYSVSLSNDGTILAIGSPGSLNNIPATGHVSVYKYLDGNWVQIGENINGQINYEHSGYSVSLNGDGTIVAIGGNQGSGAKDVSRVYQNQDGSWQQIGQNINAVNYYDETGYSISLSDDGYTVAIGAPGNNTYTGQARVYHFQEDAWSQVGDFIDGVAEYDNFGRSVSLNSDGTIVAIGSSNNGDYPNSYGYVHIFQNQGGNWIQLSNSIAGETASDWAYYSVCLSSDGETVAIGAPCNGGAFSRAGQVRAFKYMEPPINSQPTNQENLCINSNTTFNVIGINDANYQWQISTDSAKTFSDLPNEGSYSNTNTSTLIIVGVSAEMKDYYYRCIAQYDYINFYSDTVALTIETEAPTINLPENTSVSADETNFYTVDGVEFDPISIDDDCGILSITNNFNNSSTLDGAKIPVGTEIITWTAIDNSGNITSLNFSVEVSSTTGIQPEKNSRITIYPNPVSSVLNIQFEENNQNSMTLYTLTGEILFSKETNKSSEQIDVVNLKKGIYILQVISKGENYFSKIVKE